MDNEQAVASQSNEAENQTSEDQSAPDELDQLLSEYDQQTKTEQQPQKVDENQINEAVSWIQEQRQKAQAEEVNNDIKAAVESVKEGLGEDVNLSDRMIRGFFEAMAVEDPNVQKAFEQRKQNPKAWQAAVNRAKKELREEFSIDHKATEDREAVAAAVRGANQKQPEPDEGPDVSSMSDQEFAQYKMKVLRGKG